MAKKRISRQSTSIYGEENYKFLGQKPFKVSWKADGVRYMMLIDGEDDVYVFDRDHNVFHVPSLHFPHRKEPGRNIKDTLLDGEMIVDKVEGKDIFRYLIYDIVKFEGKPVGKCNFGTRLHCIGHEIIGPRNSAIQSGAIDKASETFSVRQKDFWPIDCVEKLLGEKFQAGVAHEIDGLIFQPEPDPYEPGRCQSVLKWKPPHLNSVDFKLQVVKEVKEGMLPEWKGYLYVLHMDTPFAQIKMTKDLKQYNSKIIECSFENGAWKLLRERTDKSFPNAYNTAVGVCNSIQFPITKEMLVGFIKEVYAKQAEARKRPHTDLPNGTTKGTKAKTTAEMPPPNGRPPPVKR